jgi:predicted nucleic acid-binding protein
MRICIDSSVLIPAVPDTDPAATMILKVLGPGLSLVIPRLVAQEVNRNLTTPRQLRLFYRLFSVHGNAVIIDQPVPHDLVTKYIELGLPEKAGVFIGAFVDWLQIPYLISANRHFLRNLQLDAFRVLDASEFLANFREDTP